MAQSAITVTPPNPTPPTNMGFTGATPPNPPNYTKNTMNDPKNWGTGTPTSPPPYFDDGTAGAGTQITSAQPALASGSGATAGGSEGTYPGTGTPPFNPNLVGAVPASTSVDGEGRGTEVVVTAAVPNPSPAGQLQTVSVLGNRTTSPNGDHASSLSPTTNPTIASIAPNNIASGGGTQAITVTGANFTKQSVIYVNGVALVTGFTNSTTLTATANKKATAGTLPYFVRTGGVVETAPLNWTFT